MGVVKTNRLSFAFAVESTLGVLPGSPTWKLLEPNDITSWGAVTTKVARDPISPDRQRRKGTTTDRDSTVEFAHDLTREVFMDFIEGFSFVNARWPYSGSTTRQAPIASGAAFLDLEAVNSTASFDHGAITTAMTVGRLVFVRGFDIAANNGMHEVDATSTTTLTEVTVAPTDETPGNVDNATMEIAGHRGATADLTWTFATKTLGSTALDFTTLGLSPGQVVHLGGLTSTNQFAEGTAYARVSPSVAITATAIVFDKVSGDLATADGAGTGKDVDLLYGAFIRNVTTTAADFLERSFQFELAMPNLAAASATLWEYAEGNLANQVTFQLPLADKAIVEFGFIGTDTDDPETPQRSGASTPITTVQTTAYNTSADIARLRLQQVDETGLTTCFKSVNLTLNNQVTPEKCLGTLGASEMNTGTYLVDVELQMLLTNADVIAAIKANETVTFDFVIKNDDGAICVDIPSMTLGAGDRELPRNESVKLNSTGEAFRDAVLDYTAAFSLIPAVP